MFDDVLGRARQFRHKYVHFVDPSIFRDSLFTSTYLHCSVPMLPEHTAPGSSYPLLPGLSPFGIAPVKCCSVAQLVSGKGETLIGSFGIVPPVTVD